MKQLVLVSLFMVFTILSANANNLHGKTPNSTLESSDKINQIQKELQDAKEKYDIALNMYFDISAEFFALTKHVNSETNEVSTAIKNGMTEAIKVGKIVKNMKDMETQIEVEYTNLQKALNDMNSPNKMKSAQATKQLKITVDKYESLKNKSLEFTNQSIANLNQITATMKSTNVALKKYVKN